MTDMQFTDARRRNYGISLLEVLISIAVLSIGLLGVLALMSRCEPTSARRSTKRRHIGRRTTCFP